MLCHSCQRHLSFICWWMMVLVWVAVAPTGILGWVPGKQCSDPGILLSSGLRNNCIVLSKGEDKVEVAMLAAASGCCIRNWIGHESIPYSLEGSKHRLTGDCCHRFGEQFDDVQQDFIQVQNPSGPVVT